MFSKRQSNVKAYVAYVNGEVVAKSQLNMVKNLKVEWKKFKLDSRIFAKCMRQLQVVARNLSKCIEKQIDAYDELESLDAALEAVDRNEPTAPVKEFLDFIGISYDVEAEGDLWQKYQLWCDEKKSAIAANLRILQEQIPVVKQQHEQVMSLFDSTQTDLKSTADRISPYLLRTRLAIRCKAIVQRINKMEFLKSTAGFYLFFIGPVMLMLMTYHVNVINALIVALIWPYALFVGLTTDCSMAIMLSMLAGLCVFGFMLILMGAELAAALLHLIYLGVVAIVKLCASGFPEKYRTLATNDPAQRSRVAQILAAHADDEE